MKIDHPNLATLIEAFRDDNHFHFVTEFYEGGELFSHVQQNGPLSNKNCAWITLRICQAIKHLHERNICHRDLKPD